MQTQVQQSYTRVFQFLFWLAFLVKLSDALIPHGHSDPLYYTLVTAKLAHFYGWAITFHDLLASLMTGVMELLDLFLFSFTENLGVIHILAQLLTFTCSLVLGAFLVRRWSQSKFVGFLAGFAIFTFSRDAAFFMYAKGDGVMGILSMVAAYLVYRNRNPLLTGLVIGLIPAIKMSGLYPAAILGLIFLVKNWKQPKRYLLAGLTAALIIGPFLIRNWEVIGNPVFPGMLKRFPGRATPALVSYYSQFFDVPTSFDFFKKCFVDLLLGKVIFTLWIYFAFVKLKAKDYDGFSILIASLVSFAVYVLTNGTYQGARFFFSSILMVGLFTFIEMDKVFASERPHWMKSKAGLLLLTVLALCDARIEQAPKMMYTNFRELLTMSMDQIVEKEMARQKDLWALLPKHPNGPKRILSDWASEFYYLDPLYRLEHEEHSLEGGFIKNCTNADLPRLDQYDYFMIRRENRNPCDEKIRSQGKAIGYDAREEVEVYEKNW